jgi:hypothetical protein
VSESIENKYDKVIGELDQIFSQIDNLSPKDAHDSLYRLKSLREEM